MVEQYLTNLQVHAHTIFPTVVRRYIVLWLTKVEGIGNSAAKKCARGVYKKLVDPTRGCDRADWARFGAPLQNIKSVEDKLFSIFSFNHLVEELGGKPVRLVPLYSARAKYITMDSAGLYELLREHKRLPDNVKKIQEFHKRRLTHWRRLFRIKRAFFTWMAWTLLPTSPTSTSWSTLTAWVHLLSSTSGSLLPTHPNRSPRPRPSQ
ncbi:hypothetical protein IWW47_003239 [Coemansia sp. RSA 2052]|nr:hypothetical protein IWW47_003239 [Coemansia sp. RSA 2052]